MITSNTLLLLDTENHDYCHHTQGFKQQRGYYLDLLYFSNIVKDKLQWSRDCYTQHTQAIDFFLIIKLNIVFYNILCSARVHSLNARVSSIEVKLNDDRTGWRPYEMKMTKTQWVFSNDKRIFLGSMAKDVIGI